MRRLLKQRVSVVRVAIVAVILSAIAAVALIDVASAEPPFTPFPSPMGWTGSPGGGGGGGGTVSGTGASPQVAFWTAASTIAGDAGMTYDSATNILTVADSVVVSSDGTVLQPSVQVGTLSEDLGIYSSAAGKLSLTTGGQLRADIGLGGTGDQTEWFQNWRMTKGTPEMELNLTDTTNFASYGIYESGVLAARYVYHGSAHATPAVRNTLDMSNLSASATAALRFLINSDTRMVILGNNVGIGNSFVAPLDLLHIRGTSLTQQRLEYTSTAGTGEIHFYENATDQYRLQQLGSTTGGADQNGIRYWLQNATGPQVFYMGGGPVDVLRMAANGAEVVGNEGGTTAADLRWETDTDTDALFVDTSAETINLMGGLAQAGSVSAPTWSFVADSDLGLYNSAANTMSVSAGNDEVAQFQAGGLAVTSGETFAVGSTNLATGTEIFIQNTNTFGLQATRAGSGYLAEQWTAVDITSGAYEEIGTDVDGAAGGAVNTIVMQNSGNTKAAAGALLPGQSVIISSGELLIGAYQGQTGGAGSSRAATGNIILSTIASTAATGLVERMRITDTEVVVNDTGLGTVDFRAETDTNINGIFLDASAETIDLVGGSGSTGCSIDASGNLTCAGTISGSGSLSGSGANTQVAYFTAASVLASEAAFTYDAAIDRMTVNEVFSGVGLRITAASGVLSWATPQAAACAAGVLALNPTSNIVNIDANGAACVVTLDDAGFSGNLFGEVTIAITTSAGAGTVTFPDVANEHDGPTLCTTTGLTLNGVYTIQYTDHPTDDLFLGKACNQN